MNMKKFRIIDGKAGFSIVAATSMALISCGDNPAENSDKAETKDQVNKGELEVPEGAVRYEFTNDSKIEFIGSKKVGDSHEGGFAEFSGYFTVAEGKPVGNDHKVEINMLSTFSDNDKLTEHLLNDDFFATEEHPTTVFDVTEINHKGDQAYSVSGNLTLRGTTKNITFPTTVEESGDGIRIKANFNINRMDFGVAYQGVGDNFINEEVVLKFDLEAKPVAMPSEL